MHGTLQRPADRLRTGLFADWPLALKSILGFWAFYALTIIARALLSADPVTIAQNKLLTIVAGMILTALIYVAIAILTRGASVRRKTLVAGAGSFVAACAMAGLLMSASEAMRESREEFRYQAREGFVIVERGHQIRIERGTSEPLVLTMPRLGDLDADKKLRFAADAAVIWLFFFAAWSAFYLAMKSQAEALGARRRAAEAESAAQAAQVRALRYQVNPHFLFNTLNSLSSLVMSKRPQEAEEMILKLSNFFRTSLSLDPSADVSLAEELALQRLYLDIEQVRFPKRLKTEIDVPEDLLDARVPGLILQPVVENAIKYGVSGARDTISLAISAREAGPGRFTIQVTNSKGESQSRNRSSKASPGTGVGLVNVCQRLTARFGDSANCEFGPLPDGGYRVCLTLPLDRGNG